MASEWAKFKNRVKTKRTKSKQPSGEEHIIQEESLVVQRLSAGVSGKAQKYTRVGAREFVVFPYTEVTIGNIKEACNKHFSDSVGRGFVCDILASDQGPSCHAVSQIPDFKVIHVRFIEDVPVVVDVDRPRPPKIAKMHSDHSGTINSTGSSNESDRPTSIGTTKSKFIPKSLSAVEMMKLGKVITKTKSSKQIQVSEFHIDGMCWSSPIVVNFYIASEPFGEGGFRLAYKANSNEPKFCEKAWVLKRYNQKTVKEIGELNQTVEQHTRKQVQMHCLARNITGKLQEELSVLDGFGETFKYNKIYLGLIEENDYVTIEEFIPGTFSKYINNDGCVCEEKENEKELIDKAQCLVHYSFIKSEKELAIVDIQGSGYFLCDPEIASMSIFEQEEHLFTTGNLSQYSINNFIENHVCNSFCKILDLDMA